MKPSNRAKRNRKRVLGGLTEDPWKKDELSDGQVLFFLALIAAVIILIVLEVT